jgi:predicted DNA-binding WGR domain protein
MRIYLQMPSSDGKAPRYYQLLVQEDLINGWWLIREWGNQGSSGRVRRDHFEDHDSLMETLLKARDQQIKKGYRIVFAEGQNTAL